MKRHAHPNAYTNFNIPFLSPKTTEILHLSSRLFTITLRTASSCPWWLLPKSASSLHVSPAWGNHASPCDDTRCPLKKTRTEDKCLKSGDKHGRVGDGARFRLLAACSSCTNAHATPSIRGDVNLFLLKVDTDVHVFIYRD